MTNKEERQPLDLTVDERAGLERVAAAEPPYSQRAQALLALSQGADLAEASSTSGLTVNQARHWLGRFGTRRLSIFPEELLAEQILEEEAQMELPLLDAPEASPMLEAPAFAGELPETVPASSKAAAAAAAVGGTAAVKSKKKKKGKNTKSSKKDKTSVEDKKKVKKTKKSKKAKKAKKDKKGKKDKKDKKSKKGKKGKKDKKKK